MSKELVLGVEEVDVNSKEFKEAEAYYAEKNGKIFEFDDVLIKEQELNQKYLLGRVLTVIDAVSINESQRKAVKDLIHSAFEEYRDRRLKLNGYAFNRIAEAINGEDAITMVDHEDVEDKLNPLPKLK